jgi:hypothetical protein
MRGFPIQGVGLCITGASRGRCLAASSLPETSAPSIFGSTSSGSRRLHVCLLKGGRGSHGIRRRGEPLVPRATRQTARALRPCPLVQQCLGGIAESARAGTMRSLSVCRPAASFDQTVGGRAVLCVGRAAPGRCRGDPETMAGVICAGLERCLYRAERCAARSRLGESHRGYRRNSRSVSFASLCGPGVAVSWPPRTLMYLLVPPTTVSRVRFVQRWMPRALSWPPGKRNVAVS